MTIKNPTYPQVFNLRKKHNIHPLSEVEKVYIKRVIALVGPRKKLICELLEVDYRSFEKRLKKHGLYFSSKPGKRAKSAEEKEEALENG